MMQIFEYEINSCIDRKGFWEVFPANMVIEGKHFTSLVNDVLLLIHQSLISSGMICRKS